MSGSRSTLITEPEHWTESELVVDRQDPFFFDHPLDHVPGTLQLFALLDMVRATTGSPLGAEGGSRLRLRVEFPVFCELEGRIRLGCSEVPAGEADADGGGKRRSWRIRAEQNGCASCVGSVEVELDSGPAVRLDQHRDGAAAEQPNGNATQIPGNQVHRAKPENIMIGALAGQNGERVEAPVLRPAPGHFLSGSAVDERGPELLIEAVRQFTVGVEYQLSAERGESQMLLSSISGEFSGGIFDRPLRLCAMERHHEARLTSQRIGVLGSGGREVLGTFCVTGRAVSQSVYNRIRGRHATR